MVIVTEEIIDAGRSRNGGWSQAQLRLFGIEGFPKGWKKRVIGQDFDEAIVNHFLELRDAHLDSL